MENKPKRKKINLKKENIQITKPIEDYISEVGFTVSSISNEKKIYDITASSNEYLAEDNETKGEFKQLNIIGKPFRTIIRGKTTSD